MKHDLKAWPQFYAAVRDGRKTFEIRRDDRNTGFMVGDVLHLREYDPAFGRYTGAALYALVCYVLTPDQFPGVAKGFVCMAIKVLP